MNYPDIGVVVPTLGKRPEYLLQCLRSLRDAGNALIYLVMPESVSLPHEINSDLYDRVITDPGIGLAAAIHAGLSSFPESVRYINWLGDDDLLVEGSLDKTSEVLRNDEDVILVFGGCDYINKTNQVIFTNKSGRYAVRLMRVGPQLIPQPGALFRRDAYEKIGGLNSDLRWAFDLDLLIRLSRIGKLQFMNLTLGSFRWHDGSLSVGGRDGSVREASSVRKHFLPNSIKPLSELWEGPMRYVIKYVGMIVSRRSVSPLA